MTNTIAYFILGILQGIFEWIPISSEGIIALTSNFLIQEINPIDIALFLHLGTLLAVLIYFRKDWIEILTFKNPKLFRFLFISTIISLFFGFFLYQTAIKLSIGPGLLFLTGIGLLATAYFQKNKKDWKISFNRLSLLAGFLQGFSVIPGFSRSGSAIFVLSLSDLKPEKILKISYLMSAPISLAAIFYLFFKNPQLPLETWPALLTSFLISFFVLHYLLKLFSKINFLKFALIFALLCFLGSAIGFMY